MNVRNLRSVRISVAGHSVDAGEVIDLPDEIATALLEQPANWAADTPNPSEEGDS